MKGQGWYQRLHFAPISSPFRGTIWAPNHLLQQANVLTSLYRNSLKDNFPSLYKTGTPFESENRSSSIGSRVSAERVLLMHLFVNTEKPLIPHFNNAHMCPLKSCDWQSWNILLLRPILFSFLCKFLKFSVSLHVEELLDSKSCFIKFSFFHYFDRWDFPSFPHVCFNLWSLLRATHFPLHFIIFLCFSHTLCL